MNTRMKFYNELIKNMPVVSIHEMEELLKKQDDSSKELFIKSFLRYILSVSCKVHDMYYDELDGFYDFEDLFSDAVLEATKLYNSGKYIEYSQNNCSNFNNFVNAFRLSVRKLVLNAYPVSVHMSTYEKLSELKRAYNSFYDLYGYYPNSDELEKLTGFSPVLIRRFNVYESIDSLVLYTEGFEEKSLDKVSQDTLKDDVSEALSVLTPKQREVIIRLYGLDSNVLESGLDIAQEKQITRSAVNDLAQAAYRKIKILRPELAKICK